MSLITRCPACQTMFKVVPDQLRISEGWVRCGQCEEIFDASAHLQEADAAHDSPLAGELAAPDAVAVALTVAAAPAVDFELNEAITATEPMMQQAHASADLLPDGSAYGLAAAAPGPAGESDGPDAAQPEPGSAVAAPPPVRPAELSFMRGARKPSRWHRPLVRASLSVLCLLLVAGLLLQLLVQERDRIAAVEPGLKPLLAEVCALMECKVAPLRQIESVVIDSSAFSKVRGDVYRLSLTLKNTAPIDLAMPSVELALTDTLDHALMRRVLRPAELGVNPDVISAASEVQATLVLTVKTNGNAERVAGYRLLAFYP